MQLRPRQKVFVDKCILALENHKNALAIAPTGAGKTIMLSHIIKELIEQKRVSKVLVIVHRNELLEQNKEKFKRVSDSITTSTYNAERKNMDGAVVFCTVQTLYRQLLIAGNDHILFNVKFDFIVVDEAHHIVARTYIKCLQFFKNAYKFLLLGVTATAERSDKISIGNIFNNIADTITIKEMIELGHLVPPRTFVVNHDFTRELYFLKKNKDHEYSEKAVGKILNKNSINNTVVEKWLELAKGRKTVIFCSTIEQATNVTDLFLKNNIKTALVSNNIGKSLRQKRLNDFQNGDTNIIVNVAILTEGFDYQPVSCIILLRLSSFKSTMIQMIGRGLRAVDKSIYDIDKKDCIVLDFGISTFVHGYLAGDLNSDIPLKYYQGVHDNLQVIDEAITKISCDDEVEKEEKQKVFASIKTDYEQKLIGIDDLVADNIKKFFIYKFIIDFCDVYIFSCYSVRLSFFLISLDDFTYHLVKEKGPSKEKFYLGYDTNVNNILNKMADLIFEELEDEDKRYLINASKRKPSPRQLEFVPNEMKNKELESLKSACILSFIFSKEKIIKIINDEILKEDQKILSSYNFF
ncbi:MAG: DEAD/DEAH box helicase [Nitrospinota bacterium]|nr:DEAD/DEAH box helicase [Nitrospinota bacterium]